MLFFNKAIRFPAKNRALTRQNKIDLYAFFSSFPPNLTLSLSLSPVSPSSESTMAGEQKLGPKKRKRQSFTTNHGLVGIFTRSKSQIYVHRNRSGRARLDSLPRHLNISQPLPEKRRRVLARDSSDADDLSCILIKDLRTRRVFSNGFVFGGENEEEKGSAKGIGISENRSSCKSLFDRDVVDTNVSEDGDNNEKLDLGLGSKDVNLDPSLLQKKRKGDEEFDVSNGVVGLDEETLQSTPPDVEVLTDTKEDENGDQKAEFIREKQSNENINKRNSNSSRIKSVRTSHPEEFGIVNLFDLFYCWL